MNRLLPDLQTPPPTPRNAPAAQGEEGEDWVPLNAVLLKGVKPPRREPSLKEYFFRIDETPTPPPPETHTTIYDALAEICRILDRGQPAQQLMEETRAMFQRQVAQGAWPAPQGVESTRELERLRIRHLRRLEAALEWFLHHYFRFFDNRPPPKRKYRNDELLVVWPGEPPVVRS